jgi:hypothetical protein
MPLVAASDQPDIQFHAVGGGESQVLVDSPGRQELVGRAEHGKAQPARQPALA